MRIDRFRRPDYGGNPYVSLQYYSTNENVEYKLEAQNSFIDDTDINYEDYIYNVLHLF